MSITIGGLSRVTTGATLLLDANLKTSYPGSGTVWTDTSSSKVCNLTNGPTYSTTYNNSNMGCIVFDGVDDYISTPITGTFPAFTITFRGFYDNPNLDTTSRNESAFGDWISGAIHFGTRWSVGMHWNVNNIWNEIPKTHLKYGWNHYALVYDTVTNTKSVYINNKLAHSTVTNGSVVITDFRIGVATNLNAYYSGAMSDFQFYSRALSISEISQNYSVSTQAYVFSDSSIQDSAYTNITNSGRLIAVTTYGAQGGAGAYTWTKSKGCNSIIVKVVGGGGGASSYCESGGSGGYSEKRIDVSGVATVTVTVGAGGANAAYSSGNNGGTSSFGAYCSATGGHGSNTNYTHTGGSGGTGSGGDINLSGGGGTGHGNSMGHGQIGRGGSSYWGGSTSINRNGAPSAVGNASPGAGGCGGITDTGNVGTAGETGAVMIWEYE